MSQLLIHQQTILCPKIDIYAANFLKLFIYRYMYLRVQTLLIQ